MQIVRRDFAIHEGGQQNFFTFGGPAEAQVVVKPSDEVVAAFPAENTGVSVWFGPGARVTATGAPRPMDTADGQAVEIPLHSDTSRLVVDDAVLGSIRTIRERHHRTPELEVIRGERADFARKAVVPENWPVETGRRSGKQLEFVWEDLEGRDFTGTLQVPAGVRITQQGDDFILQGSAPFDFTMTAEVPYEPLRRYETDELLSPGTADLVESLEGPSKVRAEKSLQALEFLATREKFMAGSWRFMTYFGRDTMLSLMLLQPALQPEAYADGMQSVLDRLSPKGDVAHEEDLGPWAERRRLAEIEGVLAASPMPLAPAVVEALSQPIYDYKMVDDDFLLPISLAHGFPDRDSLREFARKASAGGEANLDRIVRNMDYVLKAAAPFAEASQRGEPRERLFASTVKLLEGERVGDWRDSHEGLGRGRYPGSVNVDLVSTALRSVATLASQLGPQAIARAAERIGQPDLAHRLRGAKAMAAEWDSARDAYRVSLPPDEIRARLETFMAKAPLDAEEKDLYLSRPVGEGGPTLREFLEGGEVPPALQGGLRFMALSLQEDGGKVEVLNTDASFRLFLADLPRQDLQDILTSLELEYPVGLMTPVGPVVANPAYSEDPVHRQELSRIAYHGACIWSWQSQMMRAGLVRQLERFEDQPELAGRIRGAIDRLAEAEERAGDLANSELWTHKVSGGEWTAVAFGGENSNDNTESNTAQLWSTVYPAVVMRERAAGLES